MNPNADKMPVPDMNMPRELNNASAENASARRPESFMPSESVSQPGMVPVQGVPTLPDPTSIAVSGQKMAHNGQQSVTAAVSASDDDDDTSIEKECIEKAKAVVQQTSTDPFTQARELSKVKAELLKRRYGKELKLSEG